MRGMVKLALTFCVVIGVAYPITQEVTARAAIKGGLINSLDANDAAALRLWPGSAESFVAMLYDRCMRAHGGDAQTCTRYKN